MQALISPNEIVYSFEKQPLGARVVEVSANPFPIAEPLFWVLCSSDTLPHEVYYDTVDNTIKPIPADEAAAIAAAELAALNAAQEIVEV
jgi:hypothetical protein